MKKRKELLISLTAIFVVLAVLIGMAPGKMAVTGYQVFNTACAADDLRCNDSGDVLQKCRNGIWINEQRCGNGCKNGECIKALPCRADTKKCDGKTVLECRYGKWAETKICREGCRFGECTLSDLCTSGEFKCSAEGNMLFYCKRGEWFINKRCECKKDVCAEDMGKMTCADSDSGKNTGIKGVVNGIEGHGLKYDYGDSCIDGRYLTEYYCAGNEPKTESIECKDGCFAGICKTVGNVEQPSSEMPGSEIPLQAETQPMPLETPADILPMQ